MKKFFLALTVAGLLCGCQTTGRNWVRSEIYFGMSKPDGSLVTAAEWQAFVDANVTPRFPAGLSVMDVQGQWRDRGGEIDREPSKVLILIHRAGAETEREIDVIRKAYCDQFNQEAVMKVSTKSRVEF